MIRSFHDRDTEEVFVKGTNRRWKAIESVAKRKLDLLDAAVLLADLRIPPNNQLEQLSKNRKGQHSIRINKQYRVCFVWKDDGAHRVEIVDYH